jgi:hypothetical protein
MDGTDVTISGCVVTNDMRSSWRKQADPEAGRNERGASVRPIYTDDALELNLTYY